VAPPLRKSAQQQQQCWQQRLATARQYASTKTYLAPTQAPNIHQARSKARALSIEQLGNLCLLRDIRLFLLTPPLPVKMGHRSSPTKAGSTSQTAKRLRILSPAT
jgi:hypothetical protein